MKMISILILAAILTVGCQTAPQKQTDLQRQSKAAVVGEVSPEAALPAIEAAYSQFIDVRTAEEYAQGNAYRARNIPLDNMVDNLDKLNKDDPVYIICRTDNRSRQAAEILVDAGFRQAIVITGGTQAWEEAGLPMGRR